MGALVSLVMTDIVGSTQRWNAAEGAMAADLELHDRVIRDVVDGAGGNVFKHTGDGMIAVFDDPVAAVGAAAAIQRTIGDTVWEHPDGLHVRAAVHTGVVYPRDGDLFGTAVNKVARILSACPPGAVLVSNATAGLLTDRAAEGLELRRVGAVQLAGFATPDEIYTLLGAGLTTVTELATRHSTTQQRLPVVDEDLIGRNDELSAIWDALGRARLVTLVGVGGMGKTRLALEVAAGAAEAFTDGAWWIDLSAATSDDAVIHVAMTAVGARETQGRTPLEAFVDRFQHLSGLVVVDNCEHVLRAARDLIDSLRTQTASIHVVATSREALGLRGEQIVPVGSLSGGEGANLFIERARIARPELDTTAQLDVIERICARLDGIPLAIELAAARCRAMTPGEIDARLDDRFRLLRGGRDSSERHRTLQAAVTWSYSLLDADERLVFDQMAVFAGGTLIDGLAAVCDLDEFDALDIVDRLISRSMLVATTTPLGTRYHQLETLRQYAEDRLLDTDTLTPTRDRHLAWAEQMATQLDQARGLDAEHDAFARFAAETENLRTAVAHATSTNRHATAHSIVATLSSIAHHTSALQVFDWVRPLVVDDGWTAAAAACAARHAMSDFYRGRPPALLTAADAVPDWYGAATPASRAGFLAVQLQMGCPWHVAVELLDECSPTSHAERIEVLGMRLFAAYIRQVGEQLPPADADAAIADAEMLIALTRLDVRQRERAAGLHYAAWGLAALRPDDAARCGNEALVIARQIGAERLAYLSLAVVGYSLGLSTPSLDTLLWIKQQIIDALRVNMIQPAAVLAVATIGPLVGRREPDLVACIVRIWHREFGRDQRVFFERAGIDMPADLHSVEARVSTMTLTDLVRELLAALDRLIADGGPS